MTYTAIFYAPGAAEEYLRAHEEAHKAAAGDYAIGDVEYHCESVPDGEVWSACLWLDVDIDPTQPEASVRKMEAIARTALAPDKPSKHDHLVAKTAWYMAREIRKGNFPCFPDILSDYEDCYACAEHYDGTFCAHGEEQQERKAQGRTCSQ